MLANLFCPTKMTANFSVYNIKMYSVYIGKCNINIKNFQPFKKMCVDMLLSQSSAMLYSLRISLGLVFVLSNVVSFFFIFILRFWNHILMCFSERLKDLASSILRARVIYRLNRNSFSNSTCCLVVYAVLARERTVADDQDSLPRPFGLSSDENNTKIYGTVLVW